MFPGGFKSSLYNFTPERITKSQKNYYHDGENKSILIHQFQISYFLFIVIEFTLR